MKAGNERRKQILEEIKNLTEPQSVKEIYKALKKKYRWRELKMATLIYSLKILLSQKLINRVESREHHPRRKPTFFYFITKAKNNDEKTTA